jgi:uncharacterized protein (DUF433 family)
MHNRIEVHPTIHFGKPCIAGTRIPVQDVLELVREGISFDDIISRFYPEITKDDIKACLQYAIDIVSCEEVHLAK